MTKRKKNWLSRRAINRHFKRIKRERKKRDFRRKIYNLRVFYKNVEERSSKNQFNTVKTIANPIGKAPLPNCTKHIFTRKHFFSSKRISRKDSRRIVIPKIFSLTENPEESFLVLKQLLVYLYSSSSNAIALILDYKHCEEIALDASVCMDILILEYNDYLRKARNNYHRVVPINIFPQNFSKPNIQKILFSIGAFKNVKGYHVDFPDIITYPLCFSNKSLNKDPGLDTTTLADYIIECLGKMHKTLSPEALNSLCQVIGEILVNAEEHASTKTRYSIGYFQDSVDGNSKHTGVVNLVILNFGDSIYEKFSAPDCPNPDTVSRMRELSSVFSKKNLFGMARFTEETLWTLYALQEGVTSVSRKKYQKRGNGSIRFIESFFNLKGAGTKMDDISKLTILSGNTKIVFDGSYEIKNVQKGDHSYKIMSFNETGNLEEQPDSKYVKFVDNYFPGTLISAKILISDEDLDSAPNSKDVL